MQTKIFCDIAQERCRQEMQHGPDTCASPRLSNLIKLAILGEEHGEVAREIVQREAGETTREQFLARLRAELIQVAAVAVAWVESLDAKEQRNQTFPLPEGEGQGEGEGTATQHATLANS